MSDNPLLDQFGKPISSRAITGGESARDKIKHEFDPTGEAAKQKNFDEKIYLFPESFNALRRELVENWPSLWALVGWRMANKAEEFVEYMNEATDLAIVFDTEKVEWICDQYYVKLRRMRGLSG